MAPIAYKAALPREATIPSKRLLFKIFSFALAGVLLWVAFDGVDWDQFNAAFQSMDYRLVIWAVLVQVATFLVRGARWAILLAGRARFSFSTGFYGAMIGYCGNTFLPARAGEVIRTAVAANRLNVPVGFVFGTVVVERLLDLCVVVTLGSIAALFAEGVPDWLRGAMGFAFMAGIGGLACLLILARLQNAAFDWIETRLPITARFLPRVRTIVAQFCEGGIGLRTIWMVPTFFAVSSLAWIGDAGMKVLLADSFASQLSLAQGLVFAVAIALSSGIPSTPGFVGVYQYVAVAVLVPLGLSQAQALAYIMVFQGITALHITFWGIISWAMVSRDKKRTDELAPSLATVAGESSAS
ncbi:MAG: flippase-like domain-containing protein [Alphaproteobacteria bacterium]|nr:flippase-like domain-containing protein [Alphaproteobacteria bacterium]